MKTIPFTPNTKIPNTKIYNCAPREQVSGNQQRWKYTEIANRYMQKCSSILRKCKLKSLYNSNDNCVLKGYITPMIIVHIQKTGNNSF